MYTVKCWVEGIEYDNNYDLSKIKFPHSGHQSKPFPEDIISNLTQFYDPILPKINNLLNKVREQQNYDIVLGDFVEKIAF